MDPELAAIAALFPAQEPGTPEDARARSRAFIENAGLTAPGREQLQITDESIPGPPGAPEVTVRVYAPARRGEDRAGVLYIHGGAFIAGDLDIEDVRCVRIALDTGCVVVSVDYRLAPENRYPAALDDCYAALEWVTASALDLGIDATRLGLVGASAGGALAAGVALAARDRVGPDLSFQMLLYPCLDDRMTSRSVQAIGTPMIDARSCAMAWRHYLDSSATDVSPYAAPARARDLAGLPPAYVMVADLDPLRDECVEYAMRLLEAGVPTELHVYPGAFHGFDLLPTTLSRRALDEQVAWLRQAIQPVPAIAP